jgi:esterase/lipase
MKEKLLIFLLLFPIYFFGQYDPKENEYKHFSIIKKNDTINYHIYAKGKIEDKKNFIVFLQGSGTEPLLKIIVKSDTIKSIENGIEKAKIEKSKMLYSSIPFDLDRIPEEDAFVLISKKGIPFLLENEKFQTPKIFYQTESLDYRVWQGNEVIKQILKKQIKHPKKVIVIGHSEGSDVVAKLGTINKNITHIGFWSGGGNTQYYDFMLFINKEVEKGNITENEGKEKIELLLKQLKIIENNENSITDFWEENSFRRWTKFSEPPINNLLKIKIPIFVTACGKDKSVPVESAYLIPVEFIRNKKENLTFKIYPNYDHSFMILAQNENEEDEFHWMEIFEEFMKWTNKK